MKKEIRSRLCPDPPPPPPPDKKKKGDKGK